MVDDIRPEHGGQLIPAKKGEVRNPVGKVKGTLNMKTIIRAILEQGYTKVSALDLNPKQQRIADHIAEAHAAKALDGDVASTNLLLDRLEGKPLQKTQDVPVSLDDAIKELEDK